MRDPRTGQELGTGLRVGRMFPMDNLRLPLVTPVSVAATAAIFSVPSRSEERRVGKECA